MYAFGVFVLEVAFGCLLIKIERQYGRYFADLILDNILLFFGSLVQLELLEQHGGALHHDHLALGGVINLEHSRAHQAKDLQEDELGLKVIERPQEVGFLQEFHGFLDLKVLEVHERKQEGLLDMIKEFLLLVQ